MTKAETTQKILSAYIALVVVAFLGQALMIGLASISSIPLAPWLALQLLLIPFAALAGWYFDGWISFLERPLIQQIRERVRTEESVQAASSMEYADDAPSDAEKQLRSEIRKLSEPRAN